MSPGNDYFILNQREVTAGDEGYDDVEGHRYHWTSQSSGAWKTRLPGMTARPSIISMSLRELKSRKS